MKKIFFLIAMSLGLSQSMFPQDSTSKRIKEIQLSVTNGTALSFSAVFKYQVGKKTFLRGGLSQLSANMLNVMHGSPSPYQSGVEQYGAGVNLGVEFRRPLSKQFTLFHGPYMNYSHSQNSNRATNSNLIPSQETYESHSNTESLNYALGFLYRLNDNILLGTWAGAGISHWESVTKNSTNSESTLNVSDMFVTFRPNFTLVFRF